jgi:DNA polymerase-3 subunit gamma/tau
MARILAKSLNCQRATDGPIPDPCNKCTVCREIGEGVSLDVLEIDGASNRGIDEIRELRENVRYAPSGGRAKVYIIDEVHMLTKEAFNALLKTLEEPPAGVYFVFATTEVHKVPATIRSRCQRYDFRRIPTPLIAETLGTLAKREKLEVEPLALKEMARQADGGLRDAQSLLDQAAAVSEGKVTLESLRALLGEAPDEVYLSIVGGLGRADTGLVFEKLQQLLDRGMDPARVSVALTQTLRDLLVVQAAPGNAAFLGVREDLLDDYREIANDLSAEKLTACLTLSSHTVSELRRSVRPRLTLEVALARMSRLADPGELAALVARLDSLQGGGGGGGGPGQTPGPATPAPGAAPTSKSSTESSTRPASESSRGGSSEGESREPTAAWNPTSPAGGRSQEVWAGLLERIRGRKMMLASFLEHGAATALDEEGLTAVFDNSYYEGMVTRRENLAIIHEELASILGKGSRFRARVGPVPITGRAGAGKSSATPKEERSKAKDLLKENPGLARVIHDLGGQLLPGGGSLSGGGT